MAGPVTTVQRIAWAFGGFLVLGAAFLLFAVLNPGQSAPAQLADGRTSAPRADDPVAGQAELRAKVSKLERDIARLQRATRNQANPSAAAQSNPQEAPANQPNPHGESSSHDESQGYNPSSLEEAEAMEAALRGELDRILDEQPPDASGQFEVASAVEDVLQSEEWARGTSLLELRCSNSLCRAEMRYTSTSNRSQFVQNAPLAAPFAYGGFASMVGSSTHPEVVLYFAREGHEMPRIAFDGSTM